MHQSNRLSSRPKNQLRQIKKRCGCLLGNQSGRSILRRKTTSLLPAPSLSLSLSLSLRFSPPALQSPPPPPRPPPARPHLVSLAKDIVTIKDTLNLISLFSLGPRNKIKKHPWAPFLSRNRRHVFFVNSQPIRAPPATTLH